MNTIDLDLNTIDLDVDTIFEYIQVYFDIGDFQWKNSNLQFIRWESVCCIYLK